MTKYNLIETNHGDSKILTTGTLSEILNYLQDNPEVYEWVQDEIIGDPAMTDDQKAADLESLQIDLIGIDSVDDLQRELDKVNLTWWDLKVEEVGVWGYSKYQPNLIGRFEGENDYFIEDYKVVNEPAEKELYIYKFDPDSETYEHYDKMPMPDFWEDYIFNASENNPIIEEAFENEIKNYLSL